MRVRFLFFSLYLFILDYSIKQALTDRINALSGAKKSIFRMAYSGKEKNMKKGKPSPFWDKLVFNKFSAGFGGRLKFFVVGGAPLSPEAQQFLSMYLILLSLFFYKAS